MLICSRNMYRYMLGNIIGIEKVGRQGGKRKKREGRKGGGRTGKGSVRN